MLLKSLIVGFIFILSPWVSAESAASALQDDGSDSGISSIFKSYTRFARSLVLDDYNDEMGVYMKSAVITHSGIDVPFSYQLWRIRPDSVCASFRYSLLKYSECSQAAVSLFRESCNADIYQGMTKSRASRVRNMFCQASTSFKPTVAKIEAANANELTEIEQARAACNSAIMVYMSDSSSQNKRERDKQCAEYERLKGQ